ncbi:MAG: glycosyltransferase, partial [Schaedlerella arabinosiphila]|nr:glycosyltransferase [Schaedlerella arabinosiphila]
MKKVSVIIPMYNSEKYIRLCLCSVLGQTFRDMEILVVDDGSADRGPEICEEMRLADDRIRICRKENGGVSSARNLGIERAGGEYLFFLDSDDAVHPCLIEQMLRKAEEQKADMVFCGYRKLDTEKMDGALEEGKKGCGRIRQQTAEGEEAEEWFHIRHANALSGIGGKLLRRAAIGPLRFDRSLVNGEDTMFLYQLIRGQVRCVYLQKDWYYYRLHPESATQYSAMPGGTRYFESSRRIRDEEYRRGRTEFALTWERIAAGQMERYYSVLK